MSVLACLFCDFVCEGVCKFVVNCFRRCKRLCVRFNVGVYVFYARVCKYDSVDKCV